MRLVEIQIESILQIMSQPSFNRITAYDLKLLGDLLVSMEIMVAI